MTESIIETNKRIIQNLRDTINQKLANKDHPLILEAGCGSGSWIRFERKVQIDGIDISEKQLARNTVITDKIIGDIQTYPLVNNKYDLVMCWDVLEHLPNPDKAILNFFHSVKNEGMVLLAAPNVWAFRGFITKYTPHWFHIFVYRYIYKQPNAGKEDQPPFPTYHRYSMSTSNIKKFALQNNMQVIFEKKYQVSHVEKNSLVSNAWKLTNLLLNWLTFGLVETDDECAFILLLQKKNDQLSK